MPSYARALGGVPDCPLDRVEELLRGSGHADPIGLHRGRTVFGPGVRSRTRGSGEFGFAPDEQAPPGGVPALRAALARAATARRRSAVGPEQVLVTRGATHALAAALHAILREGDEVLVLSPQWLFATGLIRAAGGVPREVPVFLELGAARGFDFAGAVERAVAPRTRAIYFNSPNNPTGYRLDGSRLGALADLAERHDLWLIADNSYESYDFTREGFLDIAAVGATAARTLSLHSFSTTYAMPDARAGCLISPPVLTEPLAKWARYPRRSVSTAAQCAVYEALRTPREELDRRRDHAAAAGWLADSTLEVPHTKASGGLYTFLDLSAWGDDGRFVHRCAQAGVGLAPGRVFGAHCGNRARLCFTAAPWQRVAEAIERINKIYGEGIDEH
ncbi:MULTISPECIES: pyridoxal phosphate-dependent aminotransferase [unclassified Streptomyces]|uniref:pyridoxal phosphate-dependent aminotransferase n=1 Tax=unclassified Streptomyces TaxID=2593676 RepID=UPI00088C1189|nr:MULTISPECIES: pyridoxal phosphate-dependent aminotransferase [unclassified Streptomyces]PBC84048.1 N-succinyldiaminopimelate aminotransferase [Streptomyces sp. 2321.6]SDR35636.1 N-succinyldiaminopimelate aminotransferase [Streptomyces sp. KS_16]SED18113.1 N-succinyldiaminopimelate aminotransferase [Streptomyces sp. 2133.1]SEE63132.1 N-succinyldiaminopimelate aminotransferase [Streptomyces sp. 2112.3]SNC70129.1 N-succinyldiaminopimelate aminotransferase [Streptomyces sp. 2114.4]